MKKFQYIIMLLLLVLALSACALEPGPEFSPTTAPTTVPTDPTTPATVPTHPTTPTIPMIPPTNVELIPEDTIMSIQNLQTILTQNPWYYRALSCTFESGEMISLRHYFYDGLAGADHLDNSHFTNEERAFLFDRWYDKYGATPWVHAVKMPVMKIGEALAPLNTKTQDIRLPENWVYYDKTDSFYAYVDPNARFGVMEPVITKVIKTIDAAGDRIVQVYWETAKPHINTATGEIWSDGVQMVMTLQKIDRNSGYTVTSNVPGVYKPLTPGDLHTPEDYKAYFMQEYWYQRALACTFEKPEDISARFFFYSGASGWEPDPYYTPITPEELAYINKAFLDKNGVEPYVGAIKMPVASINKALTILGITIKDLEIPDRWVYYDKADAYYVWVSDAFGVAPWTITYVEKGTNGIVNLYWETDQSHMNTATGEYWRTGQKMIMTLQHKPDGSLQVLSNIPAQSNQSDIAEFQKLLTTKQDDNWYRRAIYCVFWEPKDISVWHYFKDGLLKADRQMMNTFSDAETAWLKTSGIWLEGDVQRMPVADLNRGLAMLGLSLKDVQIPEEWRYFQETDAYYISRFDVSYISGVTVLQVRKNTGPAADLVEVYWKTDGMYYDLVTGENLTGAKMCLTLQPQKDGTYKILSNVPVWYQPLN